MRRTVFSLALASVILVALAAPALAIRDPFDPVIDTSVSTSGGTNAADPDGGTDPVTPADPDGARADVFPNTGADTTGWLAIAYVLVASGLALVVFARIRQPAPVQRRLR